MLNRVIAAIENLETIMIDVEIDDDLCFHMEFIPEEIETTETTAFIYGTNGDLFEFRTDKIFINSDDFYCIEGEHYGKAIVTFA